MSNFGFDSLRLVRPYDVAFREARSAVRAGHILERAEIFDTVAAAVADCTLVVGTTAAERRELHVPLYRLEGACGVIRERAAGSAVALLFGSEKFGLSNDDMSHCHALLRIPTRTEHGSMNLGQAVAVCLYELRRDPEAVTQRFEPQPVANAEEYERITGLLAELLQLSGYVPERTSVSAELKTRRLVRRLQIPSADAETWTGMLRQVLWRVKQGG